MRAPSLIAATLACAMASACRPSANRAPPPPADQVAVVLENGRLVPTSGHVEFASGGYELDFEDLESMSVLMAIRNAMVDNPSLEIVVEGHTDSRGDAEFNRNLSEMRAHAIVGWLNNAGVEMERLSALGYGEDEPAINEGDCTHQDGMPHPPSDICEDVWVTNRRVDFSVITGPETLARAPR